MDQYRMIDGKDFSDFISGFLSFLWGICRYALRSLREYYAAAILVFICTFAIGLFCRYRSKVYYESVMVCSFRELDKKVYGEMIHDLDILAQESSYSALSRQLNISPKDAGQIISIEGKNRAGSMLYEDITQDKLPLYFYVRAIDPAVFPVMEPALLSYLNTHDPYLNAKIHQDSVEINSRVRVLTRNITVADSVITIIPVILKKSVYLSDTSVSAARFASLLLHKSDMENEMIMQERRQDELKRNVEMLHGFTVSDQPLSNKDSILRLTIIASLVLSCSTAVVLRAFYNGKNIQPA